MTGIKIVKAKVVSEDERRTIIEVMNGQNTIRNIKMLYVKKGQLLGNHWHQYPEVMYILDGKVSYRMKHMRTGEQEDYVLEKGDVVFREAGIAHAGRFLTDSIVLDASSKEYTSAEFNDIIEIIME